MPKSIVVPTDGSERSLGALGPAARLAEALGIEIDVVSAGPQDRAETRALQIKEAAERHQATLRTVSIVDSDDPVTVISDHLRGTPDALVVMSTHGHTGIETLLIGSVAEKLLRAIDGPVLLIGPRCEQAAGLTTGPVLVPTDGSAASLAIVDPLVDLVGSLPEPPAIWTVSVSQPTDFSLDSQLPPGDVDEAAAVRRAAAQLEAAIGTSIEWDVLHGDKPAAALTDMARRLSAGLLAMATHGRSGFARVTLGSITMATVRHAPCPVLVVRPRALRDRS